MKTLTTAFAFAMLLFFALSAQQAYGGSEHDHSGDHSHEHAAGADEPYVPSSGIGDSDCKDVIHTKVNGLVCDFCARSLEKVFLKHDNVAGINVDLAGGSVKIAMKPGKTIDDKTLGKLLKDSGFNMTSVERGCETLTG